MAIDAETVQRFVWKIVKFSMISVSRFVQKHPLVSSVMLIFFLLYLFLPTVFYYIIYTCPVVLCIYVFVRYNLKSECSEIKNDKKVAEKSFVESKSRAAYDAAVVSRNDNKPVIHDDQMSRRRHVNKELDAEFRNKETGTILDKIPDDASAFGSQNVTTEEKTSANLDLGEGSSQNVSAADNVQAHDQRNSVLESEHSVNDLNVQKGLAEQSEKGNVVATGSGGVEEEVESSDEEEMQPERNNAVEWTADDQQNLMDLGDSELERNKRLESLIARRRARKLFKMAVEKRVMDSGIGSGGPMPPISIVRDNILNNVPSNQDFIEGLQIPGSAPSILFPARNPFDIPYDPQEERPNLTGDSFQEEFSNLQRDLLFCRHESFFLGPSFSIDSQQDQHDSHFGSYGTEKRTSPGLRLSRHRTVSGTSAHDEVIDDLKVSQEVEGEALSRDISATDLVELGNQSPKESNYSDESKHGMAGMKGEADRSEFQGETDSARDNNRELCSFASDEAGELSFHAHTLSNIGNLEPKVERHRQNLSDRVRSSLTFTIPEDIALNGPSSISCPPAFDKPRMDDCLFFRDKGPCHSPGYSIASDLQVEVSEVGSPPMPIDETLSPADGEAFFDGDVEKDIPSGSEEMWGAPCHLVGVDENESRSREVNEVRVDDILQAGLSAMKQNLHNPIASSSLPEQVGEQDRSNTPSLSSSRTEMQEDHTHSKHPDKKVAENVQHGLEEVPKSSNSSYGLPPPIPHKVSPVLKDLVSRPHREVSYMQKESTNPPSEESAEMNVNPEANDRVVHASNEKDNLKSSEEMDGGSEISTNKDAVLELSQLPENITSDSTMTSAARSCDKPAEQQRAIDLEGDPRLNGHKEVGSFSMTTEVQDEQNTGEAGVFGLNQSLGNPITSPPLTRILEANQISTISSSCSSPRSVLPGINQRLSSASLDQQTPTQSNEEQSIKDEIVRNNSLDDMFTESVDLASQPETSQDLVADPPDFPSSSSSIRMSEEASDGVVEDTSQLEISDQAANVLPESTTGSTSESKENAESMGKEQGTQHSPGQSTREVDLADSINASEEKSKEETGKPILDNEGESKSVVQEKSDIKPSVQVAAETAVEKEPSDPFGKKPTAEANDMSNRSLIDQQNVSEKSKNTDD